MVRGLETAVRAPSWADPNGVQVRKVGDHVAMLAGAETVAPHNLTDGEAVLSC